MRLEVAPWVGRRGASPWVDTRLALSGYAPRLGWIRASPWVGTRLALGGYAPRLGWVRASPWVDTRLALGGYAPRLGFRVCAVDYSCCALGWSHRPGVVPRYSYALWVLIRHPGAFDAYPQHQNRTRIDALAEPAHARAHNPSRRCRRRRRSCTPTRTRAPPPSTCRAPRTWFECARVGCDWEGGREGGREGGWVGGWVG